MLVWLTGRPEYLRRVTSAWLTDQFSTRTAVFVLAIPANLIGGLLIIRSAKYIRGDLSLAVAELREEQAEHRRRAAAPHTVPVVQVNFLSVPTVDARWCANRLALRSTDTPSRNGSWC